MATTDTTTKTATEPTATTPANRARRRRLLRAVLVVAVIGLALAGAGVWWFLRDDAPPEVSLEAATESVTADDGTSADTATVDATTSEVAADETASGGDSDVAGTWSVDTDTGDFDYESATGSFVGFRIEEELRSIGATTAVGRTGDIAGTITIEDTTLVAAEFEIDLTTITTESSNRDDNVQDALETTEFPTATFILTEPIELGAAAVEGEPIAVAAVGDLTIHGVTRSTEFALDAQLVDGTIVVVSTTDIVFADYGVEVPDGGPVISVDDVGVLEFQLLFTR